MTPSNELPLDIFKDCERIDDEFMRSLLQGGLTQQSTLKVKTDEQRVQNRVAAAKTRSRKRDELLSLRLRCQLLENENKALRYHCYYMTPSPIMADPVPKIGIPKIALPRPFEEYIQ